MDIEVREPQRTQRRTEEVGIRRPIYPDTLCGCFYCLEMFDFREIKEYVDDGLTPICPKCGIDSVVIESPGRTLTVEFLKEEHSHSFGSGPNK